MLNLCAIAFKFLFEILYIVTSMMTCNNVENAHAYIYTRVFNVRGVQTGIKVLQWS